MNDPRALEFAQRAVRMAPANADILDTLGVVQLKQGDAHKGVETLTAALALAPNRPELRLHRAKGLMKVARFDEAKAELLALGAEANEFQGKTEIPQLLKTLSR